MFAVYLRKKETWSQVWPTCGEDVCLKNQKKKTITNIARKADAEWKYKNRMKKRLRIMKKREQASNAIKNNSDSADSDRTESDMDIED